MHKWLLIHQKEKKRKENGPQQKYKGETEGQESDKLGWRENKGRNTERKSEGSQHRAQLLEVGWKFPAARAECRVSIKWK